MAIANILGNVLTDSGVNISSLVAGSGTTNYVPKFTAGGSIGNSLIFDNGTNIGIVTATPSYNLDVQGSLRNTGNAYFGTSGSGVGINTTSLTSNSFLTIQSAAAASQLSLVLRGHNTTNAGGFRLLSSDESTVNYSVYADNTVGLNFSTTSSTYIQSISFSTGTSGLILGNSTALYIRGAGNRDLSLGSNNTNDRVIIKSSTGNLLVGTSTDSGQKFQVSGTSSFGGDVTITTTTSARTLTINKASAYNAINFQASTAEFSFNNGSAVIIQVPGSTFKHNNSGVFFSGFQNASFVQFLESSTNNTIFYVKNGDTQQWNWAKNLKIDGGTSASQCDASSILELSSTTKGFLPPRMTGAQAEAIGTPAAGLLVYANNGNGVTITTTGWWGYDGGAWVKLN